MKTTKNYKQKTLTDSVLVIGCLSAILGLAGCQDEGAAEKAGKKSIVQLKRPRSTLNR